VNDRDIALVDELSLDQTWKRYQLDYPDASLGRFEIVGFDIPKYDPMRMSIINKEGAGRDPGHGHFRKLIENRGQPGQIIWMSDTKAEITEHYPFFNAIRKYRAKRIIINGLGLGLAVKGALTFPSVEHIDVVEMDNEVAALVTPLIRDDRVTVHIGDAYKIEFRGPNRWDIAWHDIWPYIDDGNLKGMRRLRRRYQNRGVLWQGCWQEDGCLVMADAIKRMYNGTMPREEALRILKSGSWPVSNVY
jgi:hypothetical protein